MRTFRYDTVDSTNERALGALLAGTALHGDAHVARAQTAGRGRLGRRWESPAGEGVYLSLVVTAEALPPDGALTLAAGLAVLDTCAALEVAGAALDWPNDVVVGDAKLAGILTESRGLDPRAPAWVVGVGLNVDHGRAVAAVGAQRAVTSLAGAGGRGDVAAAEGHLVDALRQRVAEALATPTRTFAAAFARLVQGGAEVEVDCAGEHYAGRFSGLDPARGLCLDGATGRRWLPLAHVRAVELT